MKSPLFDALSPYAVWEGEVFEEVERLAEVTRSDAQGIVGAQEFTMSQAWGAGLSAADAAKRVLDASAQGVAAALAPNRPKP